MTINVAIKKKVCHTFRKLKISQQSEQNASFDPTSPSEILFPPQPFKGHSDIHLQHKGRSYSIVVIACTSHNSKKLLLCKKKHCLFTRIISIRKMNDFGHANRHSSKSSSCATAVVCFLNVTLHSKVEGRRQRGWQQCTRMNNIQRCMSLGTVDAVCAAHDKVRQCCAP